MEEYFRTQKYEIYGDCGVGGFCISYGQCECYNNNTNGFYLEKNEDSNKCVVCNNKYYPEPDLSNKYSIIYNWEESNLCKIYCDRGRNM